ncbi:MAG: hypothetical protein AAF533_08910 [Acidobacteriota bacterium]
MSADSEQSEEVEEAPVAASPDPDPSLDDSAPERSPLQRRRLLIGAFLASVLLPLAFTFFTQQVWEDYFITFRHSRNWAQGHGLVYQPGEKIHGFTSPLNVVIPALFDRAFGVPESYLPALWGYRIVSILALAFGAVVFVDLLWRRGVAVPLIVFFAGAYAIQVRSVAFAINGQEAGFVLASLALAFSAAHDGAATAWKRAGVAWGCLLWSRPDGCVLIAIMGLIGLLHRRASFMDELRGMLRAALVCTAVYLPWFIGTWVYYGTPVPHTIIAKVNMKIEGTDPIFFLRLWLSKTIDASSGCFEPIYGQTGWPTYIDGFVFFSGLLCVTLWLWPVQDRLVKMASLSCALVVVYLGYVSVKAMLFPWYTPPAATLGLLALVLGVSDLASRWAVPRWRALACWVPLTVIGLYFVQLFSASAAQLRVQQEVVEEGVRKQVGLFLSEAVKDDETVYLEALGYIGYFAGKHMLDFPGLASPSVVAARREHGDDFYVVIQHLQPDWLVLRPKEAFQAASRPELQKLYGHVRVFDRRKDVDESPVMGKPYLRVDATWHVFRRLSAAPETEAPEAGGDQG